MQRLQMFILMNFQHTLNVKMPILLISHIWKIWNEFNAANVVVTSYFHVHLTVKTIANV